MDDAARSSPAGTAAPDAASSPSAPSTAAAPGPLPPPFTWLSPDQAALAAFLLLALALLFTHSLHFLRWGCRPVELHQALTIDLNEAPRAALLQVPGIGPNTAERIDEYRRQGPFQSVDDLTRVPGIKQATLQKLRPWLTVKAGEAGETPPPVRAAPAKPVKKPALSKKAAAWTGPPLDVNEASAQELQRIPGVGPKTAQRIFEERQRGRFENVDGLRRVPGIGVKTLERLRPYVQVVAPAAVRVAASKSSSGP